MAMVWSSMLDSQINRFIHAIEPSRSCVLTKSLVALLSRGIAVIGRASWLGRIAWMSPARVLSAGRLLYGGKPVALFYHTLCARIADEEDEL